MDLVVQDRMVSVDLVCMAVLVPYQAQAATVLYLELGDILAPVLMLVKVH